MYFFCRFFPLPQHSAYPSSKSIEKEERPKKSLMCDNSLGVADDPEQAQLLLQQRKARGLSLMVANASTSRYNTVPTPNRGRCCYRAVRASWRVEWAQRAWQRAIVGETAQTLPKRTEPRPLWRAYAISFMDSLFPLSKVKKNQCRDTRATEKQNAKINRRTMRVCLFNVTQGMEYILQKRIVRAKSTDVPKSPAKLASATITQWRMLTN